MGADSITTVIRAYRVVYNNYNETGEEGSREDERPTKGN